MAGLQASSSAESDDAAAVVGGLPAVVVDGWAEQGRGQLSRKRFAAAVDAHSCH